MWCRLVWRQIQRTTRLRATWLRVVVAGHTDRPLDDETVSGDQTLVLHYCYLVRGELWRIAGFGSFEAFQTGLIDGEYQLESGLIEVLAYLLSSERYSAKRH